VIVLGIDAAAKSGWGIVDTTAGRPRLLDFGIAKVGNYRSLTAVVGAAIKLGAAKAAIEFPYVSVNPDTALKLGTVVGRWMQECDRAALAFETFTASQWQMQLLAGLITNRSPREARKRAAAIWVKSTFGIVALEDEADGICLASWRAKVGRFNGS
jgi:Holliday junction resolvasome RuvABC endonuclease subunit